MLWRGIDFGWVDAAWLLPFALLIAFAYFFLERYRNNKLASLGESSILQAFVVERSSVLFWTKVILLCVAWVCAIAAMMQPRGNPRFLGAEPKDKQETAQEMDTHRRHDIVFLLDVSASMGVSDNGQGNAQRLGVAKVVVDSIISRLGGENVALQAFTSQALPIVPLTTDYLFTRLMLRALAINEGETAGTNVLKGLEDVLPMFEKTPITIAKTLVVLSDGGDTDTEGAAGKEHLGLIATTIDKIKRSGVRVLIVGIGSLTGAKVPDLTYEGKPIESAQQVAFLQGMASPKGYFDGDAESSLTVAKKIGNDIDGRTVVRQERAETIKSDQALDYDLYYQYPLAIALGALALFLAIPDTVRRRQVSEV